jgi:hypothetical protein
MDINGAKALRERLGSKGGEEAPRSPADVPEDAPPVYQWLGVSQPASERPPVAADDDEDASSGTSLFRRLGLSFR